jgi:hypothetical protein
MPAASESAGDPTVIFDASDEAMLDMVAMEMAAPDTDAAYEPEIEETTDGEIAEHRVPPLAAASGAQAKEAVAAKNLHVPVDDIEITFITDVSDSKAEPAVVAPAGAPIQVSLEAEPALSLGSSLLANGIVSRRASGPDPLAAIRRMTQNEKIAFFS